MPLSPLRALILAALTAGLTACAPSPSHAPDYTTGQAWLCRPSQGGSAACTPDLSATVIEDSGAAHLERAQAQPAAPVDCFYVYPTISWDWGNNSDLHPSAGGEWAIYREQAARFSSVCRVFAPLYRQTPIPTLLGLRRGDPELAYQDVKAAWQTYLREDNHGRPFVLLGHSQGSRHLARLLAEEIEPDSALHARMLSAILPGAPIAVPQGKDVGGDLKRTPLCRQQGQTGCLVTYASFDERQPPPPARPGRPSLGRVAEHAGPEPLEAACVNPAALAGGDAALTPYFLRERTFPILTPLQRRPAPWLAGAKVETPYVSLPGWVSAECVRRDGASYLEIRRMKRPGDPRTDDLGGVINAAGIPLRGWGLHLLDINLAQGDLLRLIRTQAAAYKP